MSGFDVDPEAMRQHAHRVRGLSDCRDAGGIDELPVGYFAEPPPRRRLGQSRRLGVGGERCRLRLV